MNVQSYISSIRPINLLMIAVSMFLTRYALLQPFLETRRIEFAASEGLFYCLVLSIVFLAAGGNVINDIYDVEADKINKPSVNKVGESITVAAASFYYKLLTAIGLGLGLVVAIVSGVKSLVFIQIFIGLSLWLYSTKMNKVPLLGNIIVATLIAILPWIVTIFDFSSIIYSTGAWPEGDITRYDYNLGLSESSTFFVVVFFYSVLAYLSNFAREIIKDIEDIKGDKMAGYRTVPIVHGISNSKKMIKIAYLTVLVFISFLIYILYAKRVVGIGISFLTFAVLLIVPNVISLIKLSRASSSEDFSKLSSYNKIAQLIGLLSMLYFLIL